MTPEALELHAIEMEKAFLFGISPYDESLERILGGSEDPEDVLNVLRGRDYDPIIERTR